MSTKDEVLSQLQQVKPVLVSEYGLKRIGIFGSFARNEQNNDSDIDIIIEISEPNFSSFAGTLILLENVFGKKVGLIRKHSKMRKSLVDRIEKEVIYV
ncbi:MAG: nucleotidyltransferase domain-containing protein [Bacteroidetes bacterium]|nr:nucleotidyltransferase domain-containing protein [Bacteroidota bacterium]MBU2508149.1 nucleotidyltransferase domain-containing protein [Bacteroidota bacterium]